MATAADEEDYDRAMEQAARQSGAMTDAVKAANYESIRERDGNYRQVFTGYQCSQGFRLAIPLDMKRLGQVLSTIAGSGTQPELPHCLYRQGSGQSLLLARAAFLP